MNILITGGAGYIGSHLVEELSKSNKIIIVDNFTTGYKKLLFEKIKFYKLDIRNTIKLRNIVQSEKIDTIIHLAAKLSLQEAQKKPKQYKNVNIGGTKSLLDAIKNTSVKKLIFSSTAAVYSGNKNISCSETLKPKPINLYGQTKFRGENLIKNFSRKNQLKSIILRYFNVVGASKSGKIGPIKDYNQLFKKLSKITLKKNSIISVYGNNHNTKDGSCIRDFIDINDIVDIHRLILNKSHKLKNGEILNCGYGKGISVLKAINAFSKLSKKNIKIKFVKKRPKEIASIFARNNKIKKVLNWRAKHQNLDLIVKRCLKWEKKISNEK